MAKNYKIEGSFQSDVIKEIEKTYDGCIVSKLDSGYIQGIPDFLILYKNRWATLEFKKDENAPPRPNQPYYVDRMNKMSFSRFIYPENKEEVMNELKNHFNGSSRTER